MAAIWPPAEALRLSGEFVELRKYTSEDGPELATALDSPAVWEHIPTLPPTTGEAWDRYASKGRSTGRWPFVVRLVQPLGSLTAGEAVGSTSFYDVNPDNSHVSVGYTTYAPSVWGSVVNPEVKFLLLRYAFEDLEMNRIQLKTDNLNVRSQVAMLKIGATWEGVLREHMVRPDGSMRDSVVFSILRSEWPRVQAQLQELIRLRRP